MGCSSSTNQSRAYEKNTENSNENLPCFDSAVGRRNYLDPFLCRSFYFFSLFDVNYLSLSRRRDDPGRDGAVKKNDK